MSYSIKLSLTMAVVCSWLLMGSVIFAQEDQTDQTSNLISTQNVQNDVTQEMNLDEQVSSQDLGIKEPKLLPDSPFYFLKNWARKIESMFTFNKVKKTELGNKYANEKLIELQKIVEKNASPEKIAKATENYQKQIEKIKEAVDKIKEKAGENEKIKNFLDKFVHQQILHQEILSKLETQVPPDVFQKLKEAREKHLEKFQEVMQKLEDREEKQLEIMENLRQGLGQKPEIAEKIKESKEKLLEKIQEKNQKINCPATLVPDCPKEKARIIAKKDEKGCIIFNCVEIEKPEKPEKPDVCITLWNPVCGVDGKTYSNSCFAGLAGVDVAYKGVCKGICGNGICEEREADWCPRCTAKPPLVCVLAPCKEGTCPKDCIEEIPAITNQELQRGWYYGQVNQKKPETPDNWAHSGESTRSACWHASKTKCGSIPEEETSCVNDSDCVLANTNCCPCNSGGTTKCINKNYKESWNNRLNCAGLLDIMCTQVYLCDANPTGCKCVNNICQGIKKITAGTCIKEGKILDLGATPKMKCCEGLVQKSQYDLGNCIALPNLKQICIKCGDGNCGVGENYCICPQDCKENKEINNELNKQSQNELQPEENGPQTGQEESEIE